MCVCVYTHTYIYMYIYILFSIIEGLLLLSGWVYFKPISFSKKFKNYIYIYICLFDLLGPFQIPLSLTTLNFSGFPHPKDSMSNFYELEPYFSRTVTYLL